jgi:cytochrome b561
MHLFVRNVMVEATHVCLLLHLFIIPLQGRVIVVVRFDTIRFDSFPFLLRLNERTNEQTMDG